MSWDRQWSFVGRTFIEMHCECGAIIMMEVHAYMASAAKCENCGVCHIYDKRLAAAFGPPKGVVVCQADEKVIGR